MRLAWPALVFCLAWSGGLLSSCSSDSTSRGCERLVEFSCGCFPKCRPQDRAVIDMQDGAACAKRLGEHHQSWRHCEFDCRGDCQYGWGACAFEVYEQVGLDAAGQCKAPEPRDGGREASSQDAGQD